MNFFFGINFNQFKSKLKVPIFQNEGLKKPNYNIYLLRIINNKWNIELYSDTPKEDFYIVNKDDCNNENIFFLADESEIENYKINGLDKLTKFNNFTSTSPAFRCNLEISSDKGGFSSYQSEYPFNMINKKGSILSPVNILTNKKQGDNFLIFKNIIQEPIHEIFKGYFIDLKKRKKIYEFNLKTNLTNFIKIDNQILENDIYFLTDNYLGIPIYLSHQDNHLSFEHTHPPHEYILSEDRYKRVSDFKKEFNEIIN